MNSDARRHVATVPFLWGDFKTFPLADILGVLALSRQLVRVCFSDGDEEVGSIAVKAGQVIGAEDFRTRTRGVNALEGLISDPGTAFAVVKLPRSAPGIQTTTVIGKLAELLPKAVRGPRSVEEATTMEPAPMDLRGSTSLGDAFDAPETQAPVSIDEPDGPPPELGNGAADSGPPRPSAPSVQSDLDDDVILRGNVSDASFGEILDVLQLNQQHLQVSFTRGDAQIGTVNLMSGQVLAASAGPLRGIDAFKQLFADHGETFEVRRLADLDATEALGGVSGLLVDAQQAHLTSPAVPSSVPQGERSLFMQGELSDFPLELLVGSLSLCRQPIELELRHENEILHRVLVKSGQITAAVSTSGEGVDGALAAIREDPGVEFLVYRCKDLADRPSVAALEALISETDAAPDAAEERLTPPADVVGAPVPSVQRESEEERGDPSAIEAPPKRTTANAPDSRFSLDFLGLDLPAAEPEEGPLRSADAEKELRLGQEQALEELRAVLATLRPRRRERALLWCILALQVCFLVAAVGLFLPAMRVPLPSIGDFGLISITESGEIDADSERSGAEQNVDSK